MHSPSQGGIRHPSLPIRIKSMHRYNSIQSRPCSRSSGFPCGCVSLLDHGRCLHENTGVRSSLEEEKGGVLTNVPDIQLPIRSISVVNRQCGVKIAVVQRAIPRHIDRIPTHQSVHCACVKRVGQELHVGSILSLHQQVIGEPFDRHVGESEQR